MILTATYTQIKFGSRISLCKNIETIQLDRDVKLGIAVFEKTRKLPSIHIIYRDISSYNGSVVIPSIDKLLIELRSYLLSPPSSKPIVYPKVFISDTPPTNPKVGDIWISKT